MSFTEERETIAGVLEFTGTVLEYLMTTLSQEDRAEFEDAWYNETRAQLDEAIRMVRGEPREEDTRLRAFEIYEAGGRQEGHDTEHWDRAEQELREGLRSEGGPFHRFLRRVGLAGKSLKLKLRYLVEAATGGWRDRLLSLLNKFLGSLAGGVPGAEAVKELKEWLEDVVDKQSGSDPQLKNIYFQPGTDPFHLHKL